MKKTSAIVQWIFSALFYVCVLGNGFHYSSLFLLAAGVLMMPIPKLRGLFQKIKLKNWLIISLAVVLFFVGVMCSPPSEDINEPNINEPAYSDEITDVSEAPSGESETDTSVETTDKTTSESKPVETTTQAEAPNTSKETEPVKSEISVGNGVATPVKPSSLPAYSGAPYVVVNNNVPSFSSAELTTVGYESYSNLDGSGRCGVALASCGKEIMPADGEERGSISSIKPTGWVQASYSGISGGYLWNRCHLIGWQLSAENANKKNLITGTRYMNVDGMLPFENMVADYIRETNNHVAYRVTPIFEGNNLVCSGVQIEAYSIEDKGEGIQFNVYCYNVQPGITIDYATGNSSSTTQNNAETTKETTSVETSANQNNETMVWIPKSGSKYHSISSCSNMKNPSQVTKSTAISKGYSACSKCN